MSKVHLAHESTVGASDPIILHVCVLSLFSLLLSSLQVCARCTHLQKEKWSSSQPRCLQLLPSDLFPLVPSFVTASPHFTYTHTHTHTHTLLLAPFPGPFFLHSLANEISIDCIQLINHPSSSPSPKATQPLTSSNVQCSMFDVLNSSSIFAPFFFFRTAKNLRKYVEAYMNRKEISPQLTQIKSLGKYIFQCVSFSWHSLP